MGRIIQLRPFIKWKAVFEAADLNPSTMRGAMRNRRELTEDEALAIEDALDLHGIRLGDAEQGDLFTASQK
jgi:hypothetical protein